MNYLQLIHSFEQRQFISAQELADWFGVSARSIRNYVRDLNASLDGAAKIAMRRGKGYELVVHDRAALDQKLGQMRQASEAALPSTAQGRVHYLVTCLVETDGWTTLEDLAQKLYASRRTISQDMKDVESYIAPFGLALERRTHRGVRISGTEESRRLCLAQVVLDDEGQENEAGISAIHAMLPKIQKTVSEVLNDEEFQISSYAYDNLIVHIAVMIERSRAGAYLPFAASSLESAMDMPEYRIAEKMAKTLERQFSVTLPPEEVAYLALHLAGRQSISSLPEESGVVISDEVWNLVNGMLEAVKKSMGYDFGSDIELRMNLARHIEPLLVRLRHHMKVQNPLLSDIRMRYPLAYALAMDASAVLAKEAGSPLSDAEIGYIALDFALALERRRTSYPQRNILVICASGAGSARLLEQQYRREFGAYLGSITACDLGGLDAVDFSGIDYVFTTVPLPHLVPVPVRQVSYFLDTEEIEDVRNDLSSTAGDDEIVGYFDERLFFSHLVFQTKDEAIDFLCDRTAEAVDMPSDFKALVHERETLALTTFGNDVAMPHPQIAVSPRTIVCVGVLDRPVLWDGTPVQAIFLVCVSKKRDHDLQPFYRAMAGVLTSHAAISDLIAHQDLATLLHLLVKHEPKE